LSDLWHEPTGATPLDPDARQGLLPAWITTRAELNAAEQANIARADAWVRARKLDPLSELFVRRLHRRMFAEVWSWAGTFRRTNTNLGVDWLEIPAALRQCLTDTQFWERHKTYAPDEIGVRFHHRLVAIHAFFNGNGRHARLIADVLMRRLGGTPFSWGSRQPGDPGAMRARYIAALQAADDHDIAPLLAFARS